MSKFLLLRLLHLTTPLHHRTVMSILTRKPHFSSLSFPPLYIPPSSNHHRHHHQKITLATPSSLSCPFSPFLSIHHRSFSVRAFDSDSDSKAKEEQKSEQEKKESTHVTLLELSRPSPTIPEILSGLGNSMVCVERTLKELLQDLAFANGVQARMDGILFQRLEEAAYANPIITLIKDYLGSL